MSVSMTVDVPVTIPILVTNIKIDKFSADYSLTGHLLVNLKRLLRKNIILKIMKTENLSKISNPK